MIKKVLLIGLIFALLTVGCTKEDMSDCGIEVKFRYDYNTAQSDKFPTDIDKINLFVFDAAGLFMGEYIDEGSHLDNTYKMRVKLKPGMYDLIAWGNLREDFDIATLTPGVTMMSAARLSIKHNEGNVETHPKHLYYGSVIRVDVKPSTKDELTISMIKNTNFIKAVFRGLPVAISGGTRTATGTPYSCRITGTNGNYQFDNSLAGNNQLIYIPQYNIQTNELISEFVVMRLFSSGADNSKIILEYHPSDGSPAKEIFSANLTDVIKAQYQGADFDLQDEFVLPFDVNYTNGNFSVTINGWQVSTGGGVVG